MITSSDRLVTMMFEGFRSRWITPRLWAADSACASLRMATATQRSEKGRSRAIRADSGRPLRYAIVT